MESVFVQVTDMHSWHTFNNNHSNVEGDNCCRQLRSWLGKTPPSDSASKGTGINQILSRIYTEQLQERLESEKTRVPLFVVTSYKAKLAVLHLTHWGRVTQVRVANPTIIGAEMDCCLVGAKPLSEAMTGYY